MYPFHNYNLLVNLNAIITKPAPHTHTPTHTPHTHTLTHTHSHHSHTHTHTHVTGESGQVLSFPSAEEVHSKEIGQEQHNIREDESRDDIVTTSYRGVFGGCGFHCGVDRGGRPKVDFGNKLCVCVCVVCVWCVCVWVGGLNNYM